MPKTDKLAEKQGDVFFLWWNYFVYFWQKRETWAGFPAYPFNYLFLVPFSELDVDLDKDIIRLYNGVKKKEFTKKDSGIQIESRHFVHYVLYKPGV